MKRYVLVVVLLISGSLSALADEAPAISPPPSPGLWRRFIDWEKQYWKEVWRSRFFHRLILKNVDPTKEPERIWGGFFTEYEGTMPKQFRWYNYPQFLTRPHQIYMNSITRELYGKPYNMSPIAAVTQPLIEKPTRYITRKFANCEKTYTLLARGVEFVGATIYAKHQFEQRLVDSVEADIEIKGEQYNEELLSKFEYHDIARRFRDGTTDPVNSRKDAYIRYLQLEQYWKHVSDDKDDNWFLGYPAFDHIRRWKERGLGRLANYRPLPGFTEMLTAEQIKQLVALERDCQASFTRIREMIKQGELTELRKQFSHSPYSQALLELHGRALISDRVLSHRLQENSYWESRFSQASVVHIEKLYLGKPITLAEM